MRRTLTLTTLGLAALSILAGAGGCGSEALPDSRGAAVGGNASAGSAGRANTALGGRAGNANGGRGGKTSGNGFGDAGYGGCQDDCCGLDCNAPTCAPGLTMAHDFCEDYEQGTRCAEANQDPCNFGQSLICMGGEWQAQEALPAPCGGAGGQGGNAGDAGQGGARP